MMDYTKDWNIRSDSEIDSFKLGDVTIQRLNGLPFYTFEQDGNKVMSTDQKMCGGDCLTFLKTKIDMTWEQKVYSTRSSVKTENFEAAECLESDIGLMYGVLAVCPPKTGLAMRGLEQTYPIKQFSF